MNKVILLGNLTKDVETKVFENGGKLANITLANNRSFKGKDGNVVEETTFVDVKIFGKSAEIAEKYLKKGSRILLEGSLVQENWTDSNGNRKSKLLVRCESFKMLDGKPVSNDGKSTPIAEVEEGGEIPF